MNWEYLRFTADGRAYFQDPKYPGWIQVVENGVWVSKPMLSAKRYFSYHTSDITKFWLTVDRGTMGEDMKKIVEEAEMCRSPSQSATKKPEPYHYHHQSLPSPPSYYVKFSSKPLRHEPTCKSRTPHRRLLPTPGSGPSVPAQEYPL